MAYSPPSFGELLKTFRKQKGINQQTLAEKLDLHRNTIGSWERGERLPDTKGPILELARHLRLNETETRLLLEASLTGLLSYWSLPHQRNPFFTGRDELLAHLHTVLCPQNAATRTHPCVLSGLGGSGKTQTAIEYAYRYMLHYTAVLWIDAEHAAALISSCVRIAAHLSLPLQPDARPQKVVETVMHWLQSHRDWLVIIDNIEDPLLIKPLLSTHTGSWLLTTQMSSVKTLALPLELPQMQREEALLLLLRRSHLLPPGASLQDASALEREQALQIVEAMDGLPLALDQAAAYIEATGCGLAGYLERYRHQRAHLLATRDLSRESVSDHPRSVQATFLLAHYRLVREHPAALELLSLCSLLQPDAIPQELLALAAHQIGSQTAMRVSDPLPLDSAIAALRNYSLLTAAPDHTSYFIHRLVQATVRDTLTVETVRRWMQCIIQSMIELFPAVELDIDLSPLLLRCERYLPNALLCAHYIAQQEHPVASTYVRFLLHVGNYLAMMSRYSEAETLYRQALALQEACAGPDHFDTLSILSVLAQLLTNCGKYEQAKHYFLRAHSMLTGSTDVPQKKLLIEVLNGLGEIEYHCGSLSRCVELNTCLVNMVEELFGSTHLHTARALHNLASIYVKQEHYTAALPLEQRALSICEQKLGEEHPYTAICLYLFGTISFKLQHYEEAEKHCLRALSIQTRNKELAGETSAGNLLCLGELRMFQGRYSEAEDFFQRACALLEHYLGPEHVRVGVCCYHLATLYAQQKNSVAARAYFQRSLSIHESAFPVDHPTTNKIRLEYELFARDQASVGE